MIHLAKIKIDSIENLVDFLQQRKFNIRINEIINAIESFSKSNDGIFDDIQIYQHKTHSNFIFVDTKFPNNKFAGINAHNVGNKGGVFPAAVSQLIRFLKMAYILRMGNEILESQIEEEEPPKFKKVEAKRSKMHPGGLKDWVENEKWVDVRRPKKDGGYEPCGRNDTSKGSKPVCVPSNKAKSLDKKELENRKRQKAKKEKEPNPNKKPNTTTYTEEAGGKSNVSDNHNIRFIGSMIPLSELKPVQPRFVKIAIEQEEEEIPSTDISHLFDDRESEYARVSEEFIRMVNNIFVNKMRNMMGLTGPDADSEGNMSITIYLNRLQNVNETKLDETAERRFNNLRQYVLDTIAQFASDNGNMNLFMVAHKLFVEKKNPFSFADVKQAVGEVLSEIK